MLRTSCFWMDHQHHAAMRMKINLHSHCEISWNDTAGQLRKNVLTKCLERRFDDIALESVDFRFSIRNFKEIKVLLQLRWFFSLVFYRFCYMSFSSLIDILISIYQL